MKSRKFLLLCGLVSLVMVGCGGSGKRELPITENDELVYEATLPDGTVMVISLGQFGDDQWLGSFSMATTTGPYADQAGMLEGSVTNGTINASAEAMDGTAFDLTGTLTADGFQLTRSDLAGATLNFTKVDTSSLKIRGSGSASFSLYSDAGDSGTTKHYGDVTFPTTPYLSGPTFAFYNGTCTTNSGYTGPTTICTYTDGTFIAVVEAGPNNDLGFNFSNYTVADLKTKKVPAAVAIDFVKPNVTSTGKIDARFGAYAWPKP